MKKEVVVESFELDHTIVKAPYIRLISEEVGPKGDIITNFDIRLIQPNENAMDTAGLHTIEHLLAKLIRQRIDGLIDCSPFGCRTGFHMIMWGKQDPTQIAQVIKSSLEEIAEGITWEDVPGTTIESCGNYKDHSLHSAKEWANSRTTTKYRKRSYSKTTSKDRYNAKKYGNAEDFYDDNYYDFDSYEDAEDYYDDHD